MEKYIEGLVSVVMPTYKRSEKLSRAIESVLGQTYYNIELLLVNDNDPLDEYTKELKKRVKKYEKDNRFKLIIQERHINGAVARNVGIKKAKGEYIAFLDDDDWWEKNKIENQVKKLQQLPNEWGGVSCRIKQYNDKELIAKLPLYRNGHVYKDILMLKSDFATGTILVRHTALDETGYFDETLLRHQDLQLLVNFTYEYKLYQLDEFLHCCDVSDVQNRPNVKKIIESKKAFFKSIKLIMRTLTRQEKRCIKSMHYYEVAYVALKCKQYDAFGAYLFKGAHSFSGTILFLRKIFLKMLKQNWRTNR